MFAKRVWFATAFTISLLMVAAPATRADSKNEAHEAIQRAYARMDAAHNSKDINTLLSFYTRDFVYIFQNGERRPFEETRNELSQFLTDPDVKSIKRICTIEKFILDGDTATVFGKAKMTMVQTSTNNVQVANSRGIDTWVKQNGRWLIKQTETLTYETTINGNPVPQETQPSVARQNLPPTMPLNPQQPGNEQSPRSKQTKNQSTNASNEKLLVHEDVSNKVRLCYPSSWTKEVTEGGFVTFEKEIGCSVVLSFLPYLSPRMTPKGCSDEYIKYLQEKYTNANVQILQYIDSATGGYPSHTSVCTVDSERTQIKVMSIHIVKNNRLYKMLYYSFPEFYEDCIPEALSIMNSIEILDTPVADNPVYRAETPRADPKEEAREAIQSAYARMDAAINSKDVNTAYSFYTSDFVSISQKGERTSLEEGKNGLSQALANPNLKSIKNMTTIEKFILEGDRATVFRKEMATAVVVNPQTGANDVGVVNSRCLDTWVKRNGRWLVKQGEAIASVATINGNPVPQETQPGLAQQNIPPTMPLNPQQTKSTAWLGIILNQEGFDPSGRVIVDSVMPGGPANKAGVLGGDVILSIQQRAIHRVPDVLDIMRSFTPGETVTLIVQRGQNKLSIPVTLEETPPDFARQHLPSTIPINPQPENYQLPSSIPVKPQPVPRASESGKSKEVRAIQFQNFTSPHGHFRVSIPLGWECKTFNTEEAYIKFTPKGQELPAISIAYSEAGLAAIWLGIQDANYGYSRQWSAKDFIQQFFFPDLQKAMPDLRVESITASSFSSAEAIVSGTFQGQRVQDKIICTMSYLQDPTKALIGGWGYSFAYLSSIVATPGEISAVEPIAASIFQSFRPTERWMSEVLEPIYNGIATRTGMIDGTMRRINGMEMQQRMAEMQSTTNSGRKWAEALGGTATLKNPGTEESWKVDDKYKYYYREGNNAYGTDDYTQLNRYGRTPLERER